MKYDKNIRHFAQVEVFPIDRVVRRVPPARWRPRATLLFWLAIVIVPWAAIAAYAVHSG